MKNKRITDIIFYALLLVAWFLTGMKRAVHLETVILFSAFIASLVVYISVKNIKSNTIIILLITAAAGIYTYEYILLYAPVLLLSVIYITAYKNQSRQLTETCTTVYIALTAFKLIYTAYLQFTNSFYVKGRFTFYMEAAVILMLFFIMLLILSTAKQGKGKKNTSVKEKNIYILSIIGIFTDAVMLSVKNTYGDIQSAQFDFLAWFVLVLCIMYFKDASAEHLFNKLENKLEKFLDIRG